MVFKKNNSYNSLPDGKGGFSRYCRMALLSGVMCCAIVGGSVLKSESAYARRAAILPSVEVHYEALTFLKRRMAAEERMARERARARQLAARDENLHRRGGGTGEHVLRWQKGPEGRPVDTADIAVSGKGIASKEQQRKVAKYEPAPDRPDKKAEGSDKTRVVKSQKSTPLPAKAVAKKEEEGSKSAKQAGVVDEHPYPAKARYKPVLNEPASLASSEGKAAAEAGKKVPPPPPSSRSREGINIPDAPKPVIVADDNGKTTIVVRKGKSDKEQEVAARPETVPPIPPAPAIPPVPDFPPPPLPPAVEESPALASAPASAPVPPPVPKSRAVESDKQVKKDIAAADKKDSESLSLPPEFSDMPLPPAIPEPKGVPELPKVPPAPLPPFEPSKDEEMLSLAELPKLPEPPAPPAEIPSPPSPPAATGTAAPVPPPVSTPAEIGGDNATPALPPVPPPPPGMAPPSSPLPSSSSDIAPPAPPPLDRAGDKAEHAGLPFPPLPPLPSDTKKGGTPLEPPLPSEAASDLGDKSLPPLPGADGSLVSELPPAPTPISPQPEEVGSKEVEVVKPSLPSLDKLRADGGNPNKALDIARKHVAPPPPPLVGDEEKMMAAPPPPALPPVPSPDIADSSASLAPPPPLPPSPSLGSGELPSPAKLAALPPVKNFKADHTSASKASEGDAANKELTLTVIFEETETEIPLKSQKPLQELAKRMLEPANLDKNIIVVAYASGTEDQRSIARRVSLARALSIRAFLIDIGVDNQRVSVQAKGNNIPSGESERADIFIY